MCRTQRVLIICDEHHHAAVSAAWGDGAYSAFADARFVIVLTGTPIRSDGKESVWLAYDNQGAIDHPDAGTYTLTYGEAVDLGYCRPVTFHCHEGRFTVDLEGSEAVQISGQQQAQLNPTLSHILFAKCFVSILVLRTVAATAHAASMTFAGVRDGLAAAKQDAIGAFAASTRSADAPVLDVPNELERLDVGDDPRMGDHPEAIREPEGGDPR